MADEEKKALKDDLGDIWDQLEAQDEENTDVEAEEEAQEAEPELEASEDTEEEPEEEEPQAEEEEEQEFTPPEHWLQSEKDAFNELDESVKPLFLEKAKHLEKGYQDKFREIADQRKEIESLDEAFRYFSATAGGRSKSQIVASFAQWDAAFRNPATQRQALERFAKTYGVDFASQPAEGEGTEYVDPAVKQVDERVSRIEQNFQAQQRMAELQQQQAIDNEVKAFKEATDDSGNLLHPHFDEVSGIMAALFQSGQIKGDDYQGAYDRAVWSLPAYREQHEKSLLEKNVEKQKAETAKIKKASRNVRGRRAVKREDRPKFTGWGDDIKRNLAEMESNQG